MRAEEEDVDVDRWDEETVTAEQQLKAGENGWEEDIRWAAASPDEDIPNWTMRIIMHDED
jgi:hypothetical protein